MRAATPMQRATLGRKTPELPALTATRFLHLMANAGLYQDSAGTTPAVADGDPVGLWLDQSGEVVSHFTTTAAQRPTLRTNFVGSLPAIQFDGVDDRLFPDGDLTTLTAATMFIVVKLDADPPAAGAETGLMEYTSAASKTAFPWTDGIIYDAFGTTVRKTTVNPGTSLAQWNIYGVVTASGLWANYLNGTELYTTGTNTVGWSSAANSRLGMSLGAPTGYLKGHIAEMLVYDAALDSTDRALVEAYLRAKWGTP